MNVSPLWVSVFPGGWYKSANCSWFGCLPQLDCLLLLQCLQDMKCVSLWPSWGPYITPNTLWGIFRFWCGACTRLMDGGRAWPWRSCWFTLCLRSCIGRVMDHPCAGLSLSVLPAHLLMDRNIHRLQLYTGIPERSWVSGLKTLHTHIQHLNSVECTRMRFKISRFTELYCQGTCMYAPFRKHFRDEQHIRLMGKVHKRHSTLLTSAWWIWVFQQLMAMSFSKHIHTIIQKFEGT